MRRATRLRSWRTRRRGDLEHVVREEVERVHEEPRLAAEEAGARDEARAEGVDRHGGLAEGEAADELLLEEQVAELAVLVRLVRVERAWTCKKARRGVSVSGKSTHVSDGTHMIKAGARAEAQKCKRTPVDHLEVLPVPLQPREQPQTRPCGWRQVRQKSLKRVPRRLRRRQRVRRAAHPSRRSRRRSSGRAPRSR